MEIITSQQSSQNPAAPYPELMFLGKSYCQQSVRTQAGSRLIEVSFTGHFRVWYFFFPFLLFSFMFFLLSPIFFIIPKLKECILERQGLHFIHVKSKSALMVKKVKRDLLNYSWEHKLMHSHAHFIEGNHSQGKQCNLGFQEELLWL